LLCLVRDASPPSTHHSESSYTYILPCPLSSIRQHTKMSSKQNLNFSPCTCRVAFPVALSFPPSTNVLTLLSRSSHLSTHSHLNSPTLPTTIPTDQPPPDTPLDASTPSSGLLGGSGNTSSSGKKSKRPWFTRDASSFAVSGYQSGGSSSEPSLTPQYLSNDPSLASHPSDRDGGGYIQSNGQTLPPDSVGNGWETRFGWRIDVLAALGYLGGPVTGELRVLSGFGVRSSGGRVGSR
jgi:hypothetical protein